MSSTSTHSTDHGGPADPSSSHATTGASTGHDDHQAGHDAHDLGHDDHGHGAETLGPLDIRAWSAGALGLMMGLAVIAAFAARHLAG